MTPHCLSAAYNELCHKLYINYVTINCYFLLYESQMRVSTETNYFIYKNESNMRNIRLIVIVQQKTDFTLLAKEYLKRLEPKAWEAMAANARELVWGWSTLGLP